MIRLIDFVFSLCAILLLSPLVLPIIFVLRITGEGKIFYFQTRIGRDQKKFTLIKFATMLEDSPNIGTGTITTKDDPRVLPFGKLLRKYKLNELPQLLNVLMGTMSLIGPRPQAEKNFSFFPEETKPVITSVRPGLSGIGSIVFRNEENIMCQFQAEGFYEKVVTPYKAELELFYVEFQGLKMYFNLIICTLLVLVLKKNYLSKIYPTLPKPPKELTLLIKW